MRAAVDRLSSAKSTPLYLDYWILGVSGALLALGIVAIGSASVNLADTRYEQPFYFAVRQAIYAAVGLLCAIAVMRMRLRFWRRMSSPLLVVGLALLVVVLIPGIGKTVNGSTRWLTLGPVNMQVSEMVKLMIIVFYAALLSRYAVEIRDSWREMLRSLVPLALAAGLLLLEPDFGAMVVIVVTVGAMYFLAGLKLRYIGILGVSAAAAFTVLMVASPYRFERLMSFWHACEPQYSYSQGYQLCQALIAFSRGEWFGVGLGSSVQKMYYLPEAHTDFLMAILAEELGLFITVIVIALYVVLISRGLQIAQQAHQQQNVFGAHLAVGIAVWFGLQAFINLGVNMGVLPTKGLTLPLLSYGGSSVIVSMTAIAMLLRVAHEVRDAAASGGGRTGWRGR